jgi:hypothetical protein
MDIDKSINQIQEIIIKPKEPYLIPSKDNLIERFKFAYEFIQKKFNLKHSIKPCEAVKLVYGVKDGWKSLLYSLTIEVLRVVDNDREKAFEILKFYYENSEKKSGRTLERIKRQIDYTLKKKDKFKVSCEYRINHFDCIGVENCKIIRGYKKKRFNKMDKREFQEFINSQINAYLTNLRKSGLMAKLSPEAFKIYTYLLELKFLRGYEWIFVSYRDLYKVLKRKTNKIRIYLNELKNNALIVYDVEKPLFEEKKAVAIRVLNLFKDPENRINEILS